MPDAITILSDAKTLLSRFDDMVVQRGSLIAERDRRTLQVETFIKSIESKSVLLSETEMAAEVLKLLTESLAEKSVKAVEKLLTYGVSTIFTTKNYSVEIQLGDRGKDKTAELWLVDHDTMASDDGSPLKTLLYDGNGGGLAAVASFILRVFLIEHFNRIRFIFMDESLSELSAEYVDGMTSFLDMIRDELGFVICAITHDPRFMDMAQNTIKVKGGGASLVGNAETVS